MTTTARTLAAPLSQAGSNSLANLVRDTLTLYRRSIIRMTRAPAQLYFSLIQPLIWFLLFGQLFSRLTTGFGAAPTTGGQNPITAQFATDNYSAFFLPAIIIQMLLFGSTNSALGIILDDQSGYLNKLRVAPINRFAILIGNLLSDLTRMLMQVTVLILVGILFGVRVKHLELLPLVFLIAALFGLMMGGLGLYIGLRTRNTQATFLIVNFFTLPLLFTSSAQLPVSLLPDWLQTVAHINPLTYAIDGIRVIITGLNAKQISDMGLSASQVANSEGVLGIVGLGVLVLGVLAAITLTIATLRFRKQVQ